MVNGEFSSSRLPGPGYQAFNFGIHASSYAVLVFSPVSGNW